MPLPAEPDGELGRGLVRGRPRQLVTDDAALAQLDHAPRILSTISLSCVATITVVPVRLIR